MVKCDGIAPFLFQSRFEFNAAIFFKKINSITADKYSLNMGKFICYMTTIAEMKDVAAASPYPNADR